MSDYYILVIKRNIYMHAKIEKTYHPVSLCEENKYSY